MKKRAKNKDTFIFENDEVYLKARVTTRGKVSYLEFRKKDKSEMYLYKDYSILDNKDIIDHLRDFTKYCYDLDYDLYLAFYKSASSVYKQLFYHGKKK